MKRGGEGKSRVKVDNQRRGADELYADPSNPYLEYDLSSLWVWPTKVRRYLYRSPHKTKGRLPYRRTKPSSSETTSCKSKQRDRKTQQTKLNNRNTDSTSRTSKSTTTTTTTTTTQQHHTMAAEDVPQVCATKTITTAVSMTFPFTLIGPVSTTATETTATPSRSRRTIESLTRKETTSLHPLRGVCCFLGIWATTFPPVFGFPHLTFSSASFVIQLVAVDPQNQLGFFPKRSPGC